MEDQVPWYVEGAEVYEILDWVARLVGIARFSVPWTGKWAVDDVDGCFLREQLYHDGEGRGINQDAGKKIRKVVKMLSGKKK